MAGKMSEVKKRRTELYKDHPIRMFLSKFLSGEIKKLDPVFDPDKGYRHTLIEKITGDPQKVESFLAKLTNVGILEKKLFDKILLCPHCGSHKTATHYNCPHCGSFNIIKSALIEHLRCGYIDIEDRFTREEKLLCPKCNKELVKPEVDFRRAGIWCTCSECEKSFDIAVPSHLCRDCNGIFTFEDARYDRVYSYILSDEARQEASLGWILVAPLKRFLETRGYKVEAPGFLKGKSGANHMFDITAYSSDASKNCVTVIDLATSTGGDATEQSVIAMFAKIYDVAPDTACLIAIPKITETGKKMAKLYNINLIEAKNPTEAVIALEKTCLPLRV